MNQDIGGGEMGEPRMNQDIGGMGEPRMNQDIGGDGRT